MTYVENNVTNHRQRNTDTTQDQQGPCYKPRLHSMMATAERRSFQLWSLGFFFVAETCH